MTDSKSSYLFNFLLVEIQQIWEWETNRTLLGLEVVCKQEKLLWLFSDVIMSLQIRKHVVAALLLWALTYFLFAATERGTQKMQTHHVIKAAINSDHHVQSQSCHRPLLSLYLCWLIFHCFHFLLVSLQLSWGSTCSWYRLCFLHRHKHTLLQCLWWKGWLTTRINAHAVFVRKELLFEWYDWI